MPEDDRADQRRINDEGKRVSNARRLIGFHGHESMRGLRENQYKHDQEQEGEAHSEAREGGSQHRNYHVLLRKGHIQAMTTHQEHQVTQGARTERVERDK